MFEFRVSPNPGQWILLEVNARPWGSLPLPVGLGVDFPYRWYRLVVDGVETPPQPYASGIYARNLVPDLHALLAEAIELRQRPLALAGLLLRSAAEAGRLLVGREFHDVMAGDDRAPAWREFVRLWRGLTRLLWSTLPGSVDRRRRADLLAWRALLAQPPRRLLFLCQGNICRSPFAAALLAGKLGDPAFTVLSAGMLPRQGHNSPAEAVAAAAEFAIDLGGHRSQHLSRHLANTVDVILVFDQKNLDWLRQRYPELSVPVLFVGSFLEDHAEIDIGDPNGGDLARFRQNYRLIETAVAALHRDLRSVAPLARQPSSSGADAERSAAAIAEKK
jgi:protein-tyrosine-phosphatase